MGRQPRHQRGSIQEKSGAFYVVYRTTVDGERKQVWHKLCEKDRNTGCGSPAAKKTRELAEDFMRTVNGNVSSQQALTIVRFWDTKYEGFIKENLKPSTYLGYVQVFEKHLRPHFADTLLRDYKTPMGSVFLTSLAKTYRPYTVAHIKNLASGIFSHAVNIGDVESNPWHDAKALGKKKANGETEFYTREEIENIISALVDCVECQLIMALCYFAGLRRGEIQGLQWGDIDADYIHIRRAVVNGREGTPKTKTSVRSVPIIEPCRTFLKLWREKAPDGDWVFTRSLRHLARMRIVPTLEKAGLKWKGYHAGRRGLGTTLRALTGNSTAAKNILGHSGEVVTQQHYEDRLPAEALKGMKLLEAATKQ